MSRQFTVNCSHDQHHTWWMFSLFCTHQRAGPCSSTETLLPWTCSISCGLDDKDVKKCFVDAGLWNKPWASKDWIRNYTLHPQWHVNLPELQVCNRIPVPVYQSQMTTGRRNCFPWKLNTSLTVVSIIYAIPLLTFTASRRKRKGEAKNKVKIRAGAKRTVALEVSIATSLTKKLISCFFRVLTGVGVPALKSDDPIDQWLVTWMLPVSACLRSPSLILGPQNSHLTLEMLCRLRRKLGMSGLWLCTSCWTNEYSE